jgi:hypothetical protein
MTVEANHPTDLARIGPAPTPANSIDSWTGVLASVAALAEQIAGTEFVPKALRGNVPAVTATILHGRELGLGPMTALQQTHVIDGKPTLSAEGQRGLVYAAGHELEFVESTGARCTVRGRRAGVDRWTAVTWTLDAARSSGLVARSPAWKNYPRAMLAARASAELCRMLFPDVLHGMAALEELEDGAETATATATKPVKRATRPVAAIAPPTAEDTPETAPTPAWETPPPPMRLTDAELEDRQFASELPPDTDLAPPVPVTPAQLKMLGVMWNRYGVDDEQRRRITEQIVGRDLGGTTKNLTKTEAHALINLLAETIRPLAEDNDPMSEHVTPTDARAALDHYLEGREDGPA